MNYTFEEMSDGRYQVRLLGEFVCISKTTDPEYVDRELKEYGFASKEEFLRYCWKRAM